MGPDHEYVKEMVENELLQYNPFTTRIHNEEWGTFKAKGALQYSKVYRPTLLNDSELVNPGSVGCAHKLTGTHNVSIMHIYDHLQ